MENNHTSLDAVFHALADPTRRAVVQRLGGGPQAVSALAAPFAIGLPAFLKHLSVLEAAGLITTEKVGRVRTCALAPGRLGLAAGWFADQQTLWATRHAQLDTLIATLKGQTDDQ